MSDLKNADLPAFPGTQLPSHPSYPPGLTKREYLAAMAMQGVLVGRREALAFTDSSLCAYAALAFRVADALLTQGDKP